MTTLRSISKIWFFICSTAFVICAATTEEITTDGKASLDIQGDLQNVNWDDIFVLNYYKGIGIVNVIYPKGGGSIAYTLMNELEILHLPASSGVIFIMGYSGCIGKDPQNPFISMGEEPIVGQCFFPFDKWNRINIANEKSTVYDIEYSWRKLVEETQTSCNSALFKIGYIYNNIRYNYLWLGYGAYTGFYMLYEQWTGTTDNVSPEHVMVTQTVDNGDVVVQLEVNKKQEILDSRYNPVKLNCDQTIPFYIMPQPVSYRLTDRLNCFLIGVFVMLSVNQRPFMLWDLGIVIVNTGIANNNLDVKHYDGREEISIFNSNIKEEDKVVTLSPSTSSTLVPVTTVPAFSHSVLLRVEASNRAWSMGYICSMYCILFYSSIGVVGIRTQIIFLPKKLKTNITDYGEKYASYGLEIFSLQLCCGFNIL